MSPRHADLPRFVEPELHASLVRTIKGLSMDAVQAAASGHPGMPMGAAEMAAVLWTRFLVHDPVDPHWADRDRFVLSAGHGSMLLYSLLHLTGHALGLRDLTRFRQWGSKTPGHPEHGHTAGVECTTGPLGTGFAAGVGMAIAERMLAARYNRPGHDIVDHFTYGIVSDGDLMEGVASEAASLAGHLGLGKIVYLYDDNQITIDGPTSLSFSEDVSARFRAYGWHVERVDGHDADAITEAIARARADIDRPSLLCCRTVIGHGSPGKAGSSAAHGAPLGAAEITATKRALGIPETPFFVPETLSAGLAAQARALTERHATWSVTERAYAQAYPVEAAEFRAVLAGELPAGIFDALPTFADGESIATRKASQKILGVLARRDPALVVGSADLAGSNGVELPELSSFSRENPAGRVMHYGVREHAMAAIGNGMALHRGVRPCDATFLVFSDFMRGALRLSALMKLQVVHIFSHDSFWLGEDGPTHQPIEQLASLRAMPGLWVVRPADARETVGAWRLALQRSEGPTAILLSRQNLPVLPGSRDDVSEGAYVLVDPEGAEGILIATGSEVELAVTAARKLAEMGRMVRVVSMPCWEAFAARPTEERDAVLPPSLQLRLSIEAGSSFGWPLYAAHHHGIDDFGASAPAEELAIRFGFTPDAVVARWLVIAAQR